jgi:apolipoprotein D and lipocalin family protein
MKKIMIALLSLFMSGCTGYPKNITPVKNFDLSRYLGKWYEIARLDHSFERGLEQVTADYTLRDDGGVSVINRGFSTTKGEWKEAEGKAYFVREEDEGFLKVSFFGPFYGSYVIFELEEDYRYAFVSGPNNSYLWFLSRTPSIDDAVKERFIQRATDLGYPVRELIFVDH